MRRSQTRDGEEDVKKVGCKEVVETEIWILKHRVKKNNKWNSFSTTVWGDDDNNVEEVILENLDQVWYLKLACVFVIETSKSGCNQNPSDPETRVLSHMDEESTANEMKMFLTSCGPWRSAGSQVVTRTSTVQNASKRCQEQNRPVGSPLQQTVPTNQLSYDQVGVAQDEGWLPWCR